MKSEQLTQALKAEAIRLGFSLVGACPAVSPGGYHQFLQWLDHGYAGQMNYLRERQHAYQHPDGVMPGTVSLLMLALNYSNVARKVSPEGHGKVARYAWGAIDYHDLIHAKLKQLKRFAIDCVPNLQSRGVVDTAPLLEREFAQLAGLGWIGKNTLLLNKQEGSYFFLAALLLDQPLVYDDPMETSHCGTCTACLDACPTDAFVQPYVLDASRCISYLTIEHRTGIPHQLCEQMEGWVFGCDVCQDVCPWNRMASGAQEPQLDPHPNHQPIDLRSLFELTDDQFRKLFRKTPMWRSRRRGMLRNAAIGLAFQPSVGNVACLLKGLNDEESIVRGACVWALSCHWHMGQDESIRAAIDAVINHETDQEVIEACRICLEKASKPAN